MTTAEALNALAERVERDQPSFELDSTIFESALRVEEKRRVEDLPAYTTSLDSAVTLVPGSDDAFWRVGHDGEGPDPSLFKAQVLLCESVSDYCANSTAVAETPAAALTAAALRARAAALRSPQ